MKEKNLVLSVFKISNQKEKNDITKESFETVLTDQKYKDICTNKGFRVIANYMITYIQTKKGMSYYYDKSDKRVVSSNGIDTLPLPIKIKRFGRGVLF